MTLMPDSAVLQALYTGDTRRARAEAAHPALDVHEAAALGDVDRLRDLSTSITGRSTRARQTTSRPSTTRPSSTASRRPGCSSIAVPT